MNTQVSQSPSESSQRISKNKFAKMASNCLMMSLLLLNAASNIIYSQVFNVSGTISADTTPVRYASVTFTDKNDVLKKYSTITDSSGKYWLSVVTEVSNKTPLVIHSIELSQNYPNPFSSSTAISYNLNKQTDVCIKIYDILGREVKAFNLGSQKLGAHQVIWDGKDSFDRRLATGIYFYQLHTNNEPLVKKMIYGIGGANVSASLPNRSVYSEKTAIDKNILKVAATTIFNVKIENTDSTSPGIRATEFTNMIVQQDTTLNFTVQKDTTYLDLYGVITKNDSPFYIDGAARVPQGETLIIEPGVTILFRSGNVAYRDSCDYDWHDSTISIGFLRIDGKLIAEGTANDSIIFTKNSQNENYYWGCIYFSATADSNSIISFSRVEYASTIWGIDPRVHGDGITCWFSSITIRNNLIQNSANVFGILLQNSETLLENNVIKNCYFGVGTWAFDEFAYLQPVIKNNIIIKNRWTGVSILKPNPIIINNTILYNDNTGISVGSELVNCVNNIVYGNKNHQIIIEFSYVTTDITYSDIENGWTGEGNISADPKFVDVNNEDFHLSIDSPCKDSGSPLLQYNDHDGSRNDMGAYGGPHGN